MPNLFPHLFSEMRIGSVTVRNRIFSTGHETNLAVGGLVGEDLIAYHAARAKGGAGLIIVEVASVHPTGIFNANAIRGDTDDCIPGYRKLAETVHGHGCRIFGQLFHPGREILGMVGGAIRPTWSADTTPNERYKMMPRRMSRAILAEIVAGYAATAARFREAGLDGCEIVASHGYLPAQFLNPRVNRRDDEYGGTEENRLRFLREVIAAIRGAVGSDFVVGMRLSGDEKTEDGLTLDETTRACAVLAGEGGLTYLNVTAGTSATYDSQFHIVPPMFVPVAYIAPEAARLRAAVKVPIFVAGRINQPHEAEKIVASGMADMCGMTRAQISDPELANKARAGHVDDIRACIACNQACIGHIPLDAPISCIQFPESGRERRFGSLPKAVPAKRVAVVGGGPAGMKAAAVAAARGHKVTLYEAAKELGGQARLAALLPRRMEFGGLVTNLAREVREAGVKVETGVAATARLLLAERPDAIVLATGATPYRPPIQGVESAHVVEAWDVLKGEANVGASVLVADWRCDWIGLGVTEMLLRKGCSVRLAVAGYMPGQTIQNYTRDHWTATIEDLGATILRNARLYGLDGRTAYLQGTLNGKAIVVEEIDTVVASLGHKPEMTLEAALEGCGIPLTPIGDCLAPRTVEEATLEGLEAGASL